MRSYDLKISEVIALRSPSQRNIQFNTAKGAHWRYNSSFYRPSIEKSQAFYRWLVKRSAGIEVHSGILGLCGSAYYGLSSKRFFLLLMDMART